MSNVHHIASRCIYGYPIYAVIDDDVTIESVVGVISGRVRGDRYIVAVTHLLDTLPQKPWMHRAKEYITILGIQRDDVEVVDYVVHLVGMIDAIIESERECDGGGIVCAIVDGFRYEAIDAIGK